MVTNFVDSCVKGGGAGEQQRLFFDFVDLCNTVRGDLWVCAGGGDLDVEIEDYVDCTNNLTNFSNREDCFTDNCVD